MDKQTLTRIGWMTASIGLAMGFAGCAEGDIEGDLEGDVTSSESAPSRRQTVCGASTGSPPEWLVRAQRPVRPEWIRERERLSMLRPQHDSGLSPTSGLMTSRWAAARYPTSLVRARSGQSLTKADHYRKTHKFSGALGLAPGWLNGVPSPDEEANVSRDVLARINSAGMHVPIWMDSDRLHRMGPEQLVSRPGRAYFGNVMRAAPTASSTPGTARAATTSEGSCRAAWARPANGIYTNPWGAGELCDNHCTKYGRTATPRATASAT